MLKWRVTMNQDAVLCTLGYKQKSKQLAWTLWSVLDSHMVKQFLVCSIFGVTEEEEEVQPQIIVVPVPVPVFVPVPLHLYTQYTPVPLGMPVPVSYTSVH